MHTEIFFTSQYKDWKRTTVKIHRFPSFDISGSAVDDNFYLTGNFKIPNQLISVVKTSVTLKADFSLYFPTRKVNFVSFFIAVSPCHLIGS